jgi:RNA 2',3'-cyclic 3'-phosphodiesterase
MPQGASQRFHPDDALRLFYAVLLPPALQSAIAELQQRLRCHGARVGWGVPENLHFTLKFLGEVPARMLLDLRRVGAETARLCAPAVVTLQGVGAFPNPRSPRVIWVGTGDGAHELGHLARALHRALEANALFLGDSKPFAAHCTIGRVRDPRDANGLPAALASEASFTPGSLECTEFHLMLSELSRAGPTYSSLARFPLLAPPRSEEHVHAAGGSENGDGSRA